MSGAPDRIALAIGPAIAAPWRGRARIGGGGSATDAPVLGMTFGPAPAGAELRWHGDRIADVGSVDLAAAGALLANFLDVAADAKEEFNDWYDSEHLPRLGALPGVRGIVRYRGADPRYLALFALDATAVAEGAAWLEAARTPWTARIKRFTRNYRSFLFDRA